MTQRETTSPKNYKVRWALVSVHVTERSRSKTRWSMMGPMLTYHLGGGEGGMHYCLEQFGPTLKLPWSRLESPELTPELFDALVDGTAHMTEGKDYQELNRMRDELLVAVQKLVDNAFYRQH